MSLRKPFHMDLPVKLERHEVEAKAQELATFVVEHDETEQHRKDVAKELKTKIEKINSDLRDAARCVSTHRQKRPVECEERYNIDHKTVETMRMDTMEVVSTRAMSSGEIADARQRNLTLAGVSPAATKTH